MKERRERLNYLDAAKGIGMLLIVCAHTGADTHIPMLGNVKVALFFILSALFFTKKVQLDIREFLRGDVQRLLVPFLIFYVISYLLFYMGQAVLPGFQDMTEARGILDCFTQKQYFNGPIWFLLCLFWVRLFCFFIEKYIPNEWIKAGVALFIGLFGFLLGKYEIDLPLTIDTALTYTPVFYGGILLNKFTVSSRYNRIESGVFSPILYMSCIPVAMSIQDSMNRYGGGCPKT